MRLYQVKGTGDDMKKHTRALICMMAVLSLFGTAGITGTHESVFCGVVYAKNQMNIEPPELIPDNTVFIGKSMNLISTPTYIYPGTGITNSNIALYSIQTEQTDVYSIPSNQWCEYDDALIYSPNTYIW